jgi:hypothetical protein
MDDAATPEPAADGSVILEEMKDMQVLRITANRRLFRYADTGSCGGDSMLTSLLTARATAVAGWCFPACFWISNVF